MQINDSRYYYPPLQNDYLNGVLLRYREHAQRISRLSEVLEGLEELMENNPVLFHTSVMDALELAQRLLEEKIEPLSEKAEEEREILTQNGIVL